MYFAFRVARSAHAGVAELADAYGSGPYGGDPVKVQVLSPAPLIIEQAASACFFFCDNIRMMRNRLEQ